MANDLVPSGRGLAVRSTGLRPLDLLNSWTFNSRGQNLSVTATDAPPIVRPETLGDNLYGTLQTLVAPPSPSSIPVATQTITSRERSLEEQLFDATAEVKILTSAVAMHFERTWRDRLFSQIDRLHDPSEWDEGDSPVQAASFATFLKAIFDLKPSVRPGLGLANGGLLIATWINGKDRLTLQFSPQDRVKWVITRHLDDDLDRVAGETVASRLKQALQPYRPSDWLDHTPI